ncbi:MAG: Two-component response regulator [Caloramator sp.]|jgi:DNA-binding NarL/FixJ family response regulator|uniref:response regulator n=1 Tax=Caloramator sp. TaxID=1871330 RepID=UPI001DC6DC68|nr:response regulator transcription factor [Caloramator sp.]MBZ4664203.1 Two-component response regulator [Caloramator sp.]
MIKILIADDHTLIREGLEKIISLEENMKIEFKCRDGKEALEYILKNKIDVALLDINMPNLTGIDVLKNIKSKNIDIKTIILTVESDRNTLFEAIEVGADGYILKDSASDEIVEAINTVYSGEKYIDKSLVSLIFSRIKSKEERICIFDKLSKREVEVLLYISRGFSNKEIAEKLFLSEKTVKNYATNLFFKMGVHDRVQAALLAVQNNIEEYYKGKYEQ